MRSEEMIMEKIKLSGFILFISIIFSAVIFAACSSGEKDTSKEKSQTGNGYVKISQEEAKAMMEKDDGHVIVDVRRADEYAAGHIPGAILIPNESIGTDKPEELPDLDQLILVYCRSGNRSAQAARKLADLGYKNVYDFGGIMSWTGEIEK